METKQIKISELVPQGWEIDLENSTILNITLKPIEVKLPLSVDDLPNRNYYINSFCEIKELKSEDLTQARYNLNNLSTENRAKAFLALMQLVELRDAWNGDWRADWNDNDNKYCIFFYRNKLEKCVMSNESIPLHFKTLELAEKFAEQFKDLINEAKELL